MRTAMLILSVLTVGAMAGVMGLYVNTLMPGLRRTDDRTFVGAFQAIDTAIINPVFLATFLGGLVFTVLAALLHLGDQFGDVLPWLVVAAVLYFGVIVITAAVNVPRNDAIKVAGDPDVIDVAATRADFGEAVWVRWTLVRTALTWVAFGCLVWASILAGRASG